VSDDRTASSGVFSVTLVLVDGHIRKNATGGGTIAAHFSTRILKF